METRIQCLTEICLLLDHIWTVPTTNIFHFVANILKLRVVLEIKLNRLRMSDVYLWLMGAKENYFFLKQQRKLLEL